VGYNNVVEWVVAAPKAREADFQHHFEFWVEGDSQWQRVLTGLGFLVAISKIRSAKLLSGNFGPAKA